MSLPFGLLAEVERLPTVSSRTIAGFSCGDGERHAGPVSSVGDVGGGRVIVATTKEADREPGGKEHERADGDGDHGAPTDLPAAGFDAFVSQHLLHNGHFEGTAGGRRRYLRVAEVHSCRSRRRTGSDPRRTLPADVTPR